MSETLQPLPAPEPEGEPRRRPVLPALLRLVLLLLPVTVVIFLLSQVATAGPRPRQRGATWFQYLIRDWRLPEEPSVTAPGRGSLSLPDRRTRAVLTYVGPGVPLDLVEQSLRSQGVPFQRIDRRDRAVLEFSRGREKTGEPWVEVTRQGEVSIGVPPLPPAALTVAVSRLVRGPIPAGPGTVLVAGRVASYEGPQAQAVREVQEQRRNVRPAPRRRWTPLGLLLPVEPEARLLPALQFVRPGEAFRLDFQVRGYDRAWYSVTDRPETRFEIYSGEKRVQPHFQEKGVFVVPVDARKPEGEERIVIEAQLEGLEGEGLTGRAAVVILWDEE